MQLSLSCESMNALVKRRLGEVLDIRSEEPGDLERRQDDNPPLAALFCVYFSNFLAAYIRRIKSPVLWPYYVTSKPPNPNS